MPAVREARERVPECARPLVRPQRRLGAPARPFRAPRHHPQRGRPSLSLAKFAVRGSTLAWLTALLLAGRAHAPGTADTTVVAAPGFADPRPLVAAPVATAFPAPRVRAWQMGLLRPDRLEHASFSFTLAGAAIVATRSRAAGAGMLALGLAKELYDRRPGGSGFDPVDLAADATGVGLAIVLVRARGF